MKTIDINITKLRPAIWNPNQMDERMTGRLRESISQYGLVEPLVVRPFGNSLYEVLSGNQRLRVLQGMDFESVPCVVIVLDDTKTMLLAQALNSLRGEDDLALKGALLKEILSNVSEYEVLSLLPETAKSLKSLSLINEMDLAEHLKVWEEAQTARLRHMQLQLTCQQLETVEEAVSRILPKAKDTSFGNPNDRSNAIYLLCRFYLERTKEE